jgi:hypothetical protein
MMPREAGLNLIRASACPLGEWKSGSELIPGDFNRSEFTVRIDSAAFQEVARLMMEADANAAIKAFGAALQAGLPVSQPAA